MDFFYKHNKLGVYERKGQHCSELKTEFDAQWEYVLLLEIRGRECSRRTKIGLDATVEGREGSL